MKAMWFLVLAMLLSLVAGGGSLPREPMTEKELREEAARLERDLREAVPNLENRDGRLKDLHQEAARASGEFQMAVNSHPALQPLSLALQAHTAELAKAVSGRDEMAKKKITHEIAEVIQKRDELVSKIEGLRTLRDLAKKAHKAYAAQTQQVLSEMPETKEIYAQLVDIRAQIEQLANQPVEAPHK